MTAVQPGAPGRGENEAGELHTDLSKRHRRGVVMRLLFQFSTVFGVIALIALLYNIINESFGIVALKNEVEPETLAVSGVPLEGLPAETLAGILRERVSKGVIRRFESEKPLAERARTELYELVLERVVNPQVTASWPLSESLFRRARIRAEAQEKYPGAKLSFRSWIRPKFIVKSQSSDPQKTGVRAALLGSLWTIFITIIVAFPIGVGGAVYLEEYAKDTLLNRIIQTNIYNLAGVPSIIYGMLGLAIFVRALEPLTSGALFGFVDPTTSNGRTVLSAGLTLALLILPVIIINAQEAIRAVPRSLRYGGLALGATKWQTIWHHVIPVSIDRIMTATILAISRAIGETAPLVVVGASTFVTVDPKGPFSKFTTLPMQIYQWSARPQGAYRNTAAAAIVVLLALLITLNASAILLRNKFSKKKRLL